jgi:hypothetical protein
MQLLHTCQNLWGCFISHMGGLEQPVVMNLCQRGPALRIDMLRIHHDSKCQQIQPLFNLFKLTYDEGRFTLPAQSQWMVVESLNKWGG